ncbi:MAG: hypothetical protein OIN86_13545 [Candidatus Methanoperedens sp.]|nr:hypothetical protein [Candidatus Methanoperedens sp.]CAG0950405.1 hypothetical protein METP1_00166 [Methanosarcinales archaeon]
MIQIQIQYDDLKEKELAEFYQSRILEEHITCIVPVVVVQRKRGRSYEGRLAARI